MSLDYRYVLNRRIEFDLLGFPKPTQHLLWCMLNPSIADDTHDDPTIRRVTGFTRRWRFKSFTVVNLWAMRATKPAVLWRAVADGLDAVGPENDATIVREAERADAICCAWGRVDSAYPRVAKVMELLLASGKRELYCVGTNLDGSPRHVLYSPYIDEPAIWKRRKDRAA